MAINKNNLDTEIILRAIKNEIEAVTKKEIEKAKENVCKKIDKLTDEIIAGIMLTVYENISVKTTGRELVLKIQKQKEGQSENT